MIYLNSKIYYPLYGYVKSPDTVQITSEQIQEAIRGYLEEHPIGELELNGTSIQLSGGE